MSNLTVATTFKIDLDFTSQDQVTILDYLQQNNYTLLAYKGASGPQQVQSGLPTWFAQPFTLLFGQVEIDYQPKYKVYVYNKAQIGANTTIQMQTLSEEVGLGTALTFTEDGRLIRGDGQVPADSIMISNSRIANTPNVTVGLAAWIDGEYAPFCAFTSTPQGSIVMTPHETVCMFAAQTDLQSGSVTGMAAAPGCSFSFSSAAEDYKLTILPHTYQVTSAPGSVSVTPVASGQSLAELLNQ